MKTKLNRLKETTNLVIYSADLSSELALPFAESIHAGFPSPAEDYLELAIDLNKELVKNPNATFYGRVRGCSMIEAGIAEGDVLVIDRSITPYNGCTAICFLDGEFTVKWLQIENRQIKLVPANPSFSTLSVGSEQAFLVWGVVTYIIHACKTWSH